MLTDYHAKFFAYELTKRCPSDSAEKLARAIVGTQVDLNPHHARRLSDNMTVEALAQQFTAKAG